MQLAAHEHRHYAVSVVAEVGMKRAAAFGRAPVKGDIDIAIELLGYDGTADATFAAWRIGWGRVRQRERREDKEIRR